jgi:DNA helicase-2/ATP-dependent DNA helicase PcrA
MQQRAGGIYFMSMHRAKGLEFPTVYIIGASEVIIPYYTVKSDEEMDEECRLLHVAIIRAKDELLISLPSSFRGKPAAVSRFIQAAYQ